MCLSRNFFATPEFCIRMLCSGVCAPSLQGHVRLSANLNLCKYDFVFPCPVMIAVNSGVMGIFIFNLCSTTGKNDRHRAPFSVLFHWLCHFMIPCMFISVATVVAGTLSYTIFWSFLSWAASLASLFAASLPSIVMWAFTHPKWIVQFSVDRCHTLFLISSIMSLSSLYCQWKWLLSWLLDRLVSVVVPVLSGLLSVQLGC